jgi:hypothetical protein
MTSNEDARAALTYVELKKVEADAARLRAQLKGTHFEKIVRPSPRTTKPQAHLKSAKQRQTKTAGKKAAGKKTSGRKAAGKKTKGGEHTRRRPTKPSSPSSTLDTAAAIVPPARPWPWPLPQ